MILTGAQIYTEYTAGRIHISPFDRDRVAENSYDVRLGDTLLMTRDVMLDTAKEIVYTERKILPTGYLLEPGRGYLANTIEEIGSDHYIPDLGGTSTNGRRFLSVHQTAGWGETGFKWEWTLELSCLQPIVIYPGMIIGQVRFMIPVGPITLYHGRYAGQHGPTTPAKPKRKHILGGTP